MVSRDSFKATLASGKNGCGQKLCLNLSREKASIHTWRRGWGCSKCLNSGYLGRVAVVELLEVDSTVRQFIYEDKMQDLHRYLKQSTFEPSTWTRSKESFAVSLLLMSFSRFAPQRFLSIGC